MNNESKKPTLQQNIEKTEHSPKEDVTKNLVITTSPLRVLLASLTAFVMLFGLPLWQEIFGISNTAMGYCYGSIVVVIIAILVEIKCEKPLNYVRDGLFLLAAAFMTRNMVQITFVEEMDTIVASALISVGVALVLMLIFYVVSGRLRFSIIFAAFICYFLTIANFFVYSFRGEVLFFGDLLAIGTAVDVAGGYTYNISGNLIAGGIIFVSIIAVAFHTSAKTHCVGDRLILKGAATVICIIAIGAFLISDTVDSYYYSWKPWTNDYLYAFAYNMKMLRIEKPSGYSTEKVAQVLEKTNGDATAATTAQKPVVIAIMNETFSDPRVVGDFETDKDYIAYYNSMSENTIKGKVYTEVFGAGTCDSEYAFITGNTTAWVPPNARPYQLYVKGTTPNLATTLNSQGYTSHAMHPGDVGSWNRNNVYGLFGFSDFISRTMYEDGSIPVSITHDKYISDYTDYEKLIQYFENRGDELPFLFNITIANHGGYDTMTADLDPVSVVGLNGTYPKTEVYLSLMRRSDQALEYLIEYFKQVDTPVIICFFGDHQAKIEDEFYEEIAGKPMAEWTDEEMQKRYCTPYFIWANYDIPEAEHYDISLNVLGSLLLDVSGLETTAFNEYLIDLKNTLPIVTSKGVFDTKGNYINMEDAGEYTELIQNFRYINYNNLFDSKNRLNQYYFPKNSEYLDQDNHVVDIDKHYTINGEEP